MENLKINIETGEIMEQDKLNQIIEIVKKRPDGTLEISWDYSNCPTMAEQHSAHMTDINYLMKKYQPDELAAYLAARNQYRKEILGHDFSIEPERQEALNVVAKIKEEFNNLPDKIRNSFSNHVEFLKFIDNPANADKMVELGLLTKKKLEVFVGPEKKDGDNSSSSNSSSSSSDQSSAAKK